MQTVQNSVTNSTTTYMYDALNRLTGAVTTDGSPNAYTYAYDRDGNILSDDVNGTNNVHGYNTADEQTEINSQTANESYDADGNLTSAEGQSASYNTLAKPTSIGGVSLGSSQPAKSTKPASQAYQEVARFVVEVC